MAKPVLFVDDGGVISDNSVRGPQWQCLVGEFFVPRLGGSQAAWEEANREVITAFFVPGAWQARLEKFHDYWSFQRAYSLDWMDGMCRRVGVPQPGEEESIRLTEQATRWITSQVNAAYPGAADTIRLLHGQGYTMYTASGEASGELAGYMGAIGVRECFRRLYGTDLVNSLKSGPRFYRHIFGDVGVSPEEALVVDDNPMVLGWVVELGARGVLVSREQGVEVEGLVGVIGSLAELPRVLEGLVAPGG